MQNIAFIVAVVLLGLGGTLNLIVMVFLALRVLFAFRAADAQQTRKRRTQLAPAHHHS